jgi:hypothetical protein
VVEVTATDYLYRTADGSPAYIVRRRVTTDGKTFSQHRPDGTNGIDGIERVPYMLPELLDACAQGLDVWIVEGEKDVHTARSYGLAATTSSGGAGSWQDSHTEHLAGAGWVYVVADYDVAGYKHAASVVERVRRLHKGLGVTVARARHGNDLTDHLGAGLGVDDLVELDLVLLQMAMAANHTAVQVSSGTSLARPDPFMAATGRQRGDGTKGPNYFASVVRNRVDAVRALAEGNRNRGLHDEAFAVGSWSHLASVVEREAAFDALVDAGIGIGLPAREAKTAVKSGFAAGVKAPKAAA